MTTLEDVLKALEVDRREDAVVKTKDQRTIVKRWERDQGVPSEIVNKAWYADHTRLVRDQTAVDHAKTCSSIEEFRGEAPKPVEPAPAPVNVADDESAKLKAAKEFLDLLNTPKTPALPEEEIRRIAADEAKKHGSARPLEVRRWDGTIKPIGVQHRMFPLLLKCVEAEVHTALVGPAGTGKTTAGEKVAEALGFDFHIQSFCRQTTKSDLLGFKDAHGNYQTTPFRRWFEDGGVFIGDEWDAGNENSNLIVNAGLANGVCNFADNQIKRADKAVALFCMNTWGGPNSEYVGRNRPDAATMDRMVALPWDQDPSLEAAMIGIDLPQEEIDVTAGGTKSPKQWLARLNSLRAAKDKANVKLLLTPRAAIFGAKLFAVGVGADWVEELVVWKGLDKEQRKRVIAQL